MLKSPLSDVIAAEEQVALKHRGSSLETAKSSVHTQSEVVFQVVVSR